MEKLRGCTEKTTTFDMSSSLKPREAFNASRREPKQARRGLSSYEPPHSVPPKDGSRNVPSVNYRQVTLALTCITAYALLCPSTIPGIMCHNWD